MTYHLEVYHARSTGKDPTFQRIFLFLSHCVMQRVTVRLCQLDCNECTGPVTVTFKSGYSAPQHQQESAAQ